MPDCLTCGACCAVPNEIPVPDSDMAGADGKCIRFRDGRCEALSGIVGKEVSCNVYENRAAICREVQPGSLFCVTAREMWGLENG